MTVPLSQPAGVEPHPLGTVEGGHGADSEAEVGGDTQVGTQAPDLAQDPVAQQLGDRDQVTVLFVAAWSPACLLLERSDLPGKADLVVDVDKDPVSADRYQIWSVPTLLVVDPRGVRRRITGAACATELLARR